MWPTNGRVSRDCAMSWTMGWEALTSDPPQPWFWWRSTFPFRSESKGGSGPSRVSPQPVGKPATVLPSFSDVLSVFSVIYNNRKSIKMVSPQSKKYKLPGILVFGFFIFLPCGKKFELLLTPEYNFLWSLDSSIWVVLARCVFWFCLEGYYVQGPALNKSLKLCSFVLTLWLGIFIVFCWPVFWGAEGGHSWAKPWIWGHVCVALSHLPSG